MIKKEIITLAKKFGLDYTDNDILEHITCGLHSGFPECCIFYYLTCYLPVIELNTTRNEINFDEYNNHISVIFDQEIYELYQRLYKLDNDYYVGYIRCPSCILVNKRVEVKSCNCLKNRTCTADKI